MQYIVKNCPAYDKRFYFNNNALGTYVQCICKDNDCVMKQIVELCKHYKKHSDCGRECPSFGGFLNKLLNKFDIQEVE